MRLTPLLCLATAVILATGCGGGEDGPSPLTNDVFIAKADRICADGLLELQDRLQATFGNQAPTENEVIAFTTSDTAPLLASQIEDLRALTPPEGDQEKVGEIWAEMDEGLKTIQDDPSSVLAEPEPMATGLDLARSYGFRSCGKVGPVP